MHDEHAQWSVSVRLEDGEARAQSTTQPEHFLFFSDFQHELHPPRHREEDKRGQGEGQDGEGPDGVGGEMTKYVFRRRNWRRVLSRPC